MDYISDLPSLRASFFLVVETTARDDYGCNEQNIELTHVVVVLVVLGGSLAIHVTLTRIDSSFLESSYCPLLWIRFCNEDLCSPSV